MKSKRRYAATKKPSRLPKKMGTPPGPKGILRFLKHINRPVSWQDIKDHFHAASNGGSMLQDVLEQMVRDGRVVKTSREQFGLPDQMHLIVGELRCRPDGHGVVISETGVRREVFIKPLNLREAMHGDRVIVRIENPKRQEGTIIRILERRTRVVVGTFVKGRRSHVIPEDPRYLFELDIPSGKTMKALTGQIVVAEITRYPERHSPPEGMVKQILGIPGDPGVDARIVALKYGIPFDFPEEVKKEAAELPSRVRRHERQNRKDLRKIPTFTVDGENARDFDDAVSLLEGEDGCMTLYVSIADVGHYVKPGSILDAEAFRRGSSIYFPESVLPMLPVQLSNGICSLNPGVDRLAITAALTYDPAGNLLDYKFFPSVIHSHRRLTYTAVRKILVDRDENVRKRNRRLVPTLEAMYSLYRLLERKRVERGGLEFDFPEPQVILDLRGGVEGIIKAERNVAHMMIEEFMVAANAAAAQFLIRHRRNSLFRVHPRPDPRSASEIRRLIRNLGNDVPAGRSNDSRTFLQFLKTVQGKPEERLVNLLCLRSLRQAHYSAQNVGHFGLAFPSYVHFTCPIRRYPDLMTHRAIREILGMDPISDVTVPLEKAALLLSAQERKAMEAQREIVDRYRVRFMADHLGQEFDGIISNVTAFGLFVELDDVFVDGLIHISTLQDDYYQFHEKGLALEGKRTHRFFRIGDRVRVRLERVDIERRLIDFQLLKHVPARDTDQDKSFQASDTRRTIHSL
ncbi:MAG: ribonuclease R [Deltaproteobacteria bacterium]|nr:ribonuclease R [Deltaproteobacteria bacterium]